MKFKYIISRDEMQGLAIPNYLGFSYHLIDRYASVFYPIPFNIIIRWLRDIAHRAQIGKYYHDRDIQAYVRSIEIHDVILVKNTVDVLVAQKITKLLNKPVIYVKDFNEIDSKSWEELSKLRAK